MSRVYGYNAVDELLRVSPKSIRVLWIERHSARGADEELARRAQELGIEVRRAPADELRRRAGGRGASSVAAEVLLAPPVDLAELVSQRDRPLLLALDGVTDPHNLGAVMRSAVAFGADAVVVPKRNSAPLNDAAVRASAGAVSHVPLIRVVNLARTLRALRDSSGLWSMATMAGDGRPIWEVDCTVPLVLVLGAEGSGLRPNVRKACDLALHVPLSGPVGSLNVSVFAGVALAEVARQRAAY